MTNNFNSVDFDWIKSEAGYNSFTLSPKKWVEKTGEEAEYNRLKGGRMEKSIKEIFIEKCGFYLPACGYYVIIMLVVKSLIKSRVLVLLQKVKTLKINNLCVV